MTDLTEDEVRRERLVHIDQMIADIHRTYANHDRKRQEMRLAPWQLALAGMTGAAFMTAGAVLAGVLIKLFG